MVVVVSSAWNGNIIQYSRNVVHNSEKFSLKIQKYCLEVLAVLLSVRMRII